MDHYAHIVGWGMYVPQKTLTNCELTKMVETTDEWIRTRTGILERRIANEKETTASMAIHAAQEALDRARINPASVDMVIVATVTPEHLFPSTACLVQDALGAKHAGAFDLSAGCTGFVYGLSMASAMIRSKQAETVVVIGSETLSRIVDWEDRTTCVLFGDGAGAVVLQASEEPGGVLSSVLGSDGGGGSYLVVPGGGSKMPTTVQTVIDKQHFLKMNGPEVFRFASRVMGRAAKEACEQADVDLTTIDLFIPHQANARIIKSAAKYLNLNSNKVYENLHKYGNTSSASIPLALCEAIGEGRIKNNDNLVLVGFGAGLTWGATVVKWGLPVPYQQRQKWYRALRWLYYRWAKLSSKIGWLLHIIESHLARRSLLPFRDEEPEKFEPEKFEATPDQPTSPKYKENGHEGQRANGTTPPAVKTPETDKLKQK